MSADACLLRGPMAAATHLFCKLVASDLQFTNFRSLALRGYRTQPRKHCPDRCPSLLNGSGEGASTRLSRCERDNIVESCCKPIGWIIERVSARLAIESLKMLSIDWTYMTRPASSCSALKSTVKGAIAARHARLTRLVFV